MRMRILMAVGLLGLAACEPTPYGTTAVAPGAGTAVGAVGGGVAGAVIGSNVAGRGNRTAGALVGGALGAVGGGLVGTAVEQQSRQPPPGYYQPAPAGYYAQPPK